jgi:hypothetical protein
MWRSLAITDRLALNPLLADESFSAPFELDPAFEPEREREAGFRWGAGPEQLEDMLAATAAAVRATATATATARLRGYEAVPAVCDVMSQISDTGRLFTHGTLPQTQAQACLLSRPQRR